MVTRKPRQLTASRLSRLALASALCLWTGLSALRAGLITNAFPIITNVLPVNVTPTSFGILWHGANHTPSLAIYADPAGVTNLSGQLGVEALPLCTGSPEVPAGYARRQNQAGLRQLTRAHGDMVLQVSGCQPDTTYYYRLTVTHPRYKFPGTFPAAGPLPSVTTAKENTFVVDDQLLLLDVPGLDSYGRIVTLSNANAAFCLAGVIGEGVGTNQVFFNASDLFLLGGGGNFALEGPQIFTADVLGLYGRPDTRVDFTLAFGTNLTAVGSNRNSTRTDYLIVSIGSAVLQSGQTTNVPVQFNSSANLGEVSFSLNLPTNSLTSLAWEGLAPELDPASATATLQDATTFVLHLATRSGQTITGPREVGQVAFTAASGQHSGFVPLNPQPLAAGRTDTTLVTNLFAQAGRAVVVGPEPLLEAAVKLGGARELTLYGKPPPSTYGVEYSTNVTSPMVWTPLPGVLQLTNLSALVPGIDPAADLIFYRAAELTSP
jgi:hypothetical protein